MLGRLFDKLARAPGGSANSRPLIWSAIERMLREENCKSRILLDTVESSEYTVGHGLREGSVLSPILYAVFVDGIVDRLEKAGCVGSLVGSETVRCLLYADDICLIADSAADLQRMLSVSQKFADESSFQFSMEKSQVVVFGPDAGDRFADEFRLMGTLMDVVSEYKYLGLILHESLGRRTGPGSGLAYGVEKEKYLYKRLLDNDEERVVVDIFEDDSVSRRQLVAKTRLLVNNKPAPGEEHGKEWLLYAG